MPAARSNRMTWSSSSWRGLMTTPNRAGVKPCRLVVDTLSTVPGADHQGASGDSKSSNRIASHGRRAPRSPRCGRCRTYRFARRQAVVVNVERIDRRVAQRIDRTVDQRHVSPALEVNGQVVVPVPSRAVVQLDLECSPDRHVHPRANRSATGQIQRRGKPFAAHTPPPGSSLHVAVNRAAYCPSRLIGHLVKLM